MDGHAGTEHVHDGQPTCGSCGTLGNLCRFDFEQSGLPEYSRLWREYLAGCNADTFMRNDHIEMGKWWKATRPVDSGPSPKDYANLPHDEVVRRRVRGVAVAAMVLERLRSQGILTVVEMREKKVDHG